MLFSSFTGAEDTKNMRGRSAVGKEVQGMATQATGKFVSFTKSKLLLLPSALPASKPMVTIGSNGRIAFSAKLAPVFVGTKYADLQYDSDGRRVRIVGMETLPKGGEESDYWTFTATKESGKGKNKQMSIGAAGFLYSIAWGGTEQRKDADGRVIKDEATGKAKEFPIGWPYKKAGNQRFLPEASNEKEHWVIFGLPATMPAPLPTRTRKKRSDAAATVPAATTPANGEAAQASA